MRAMLGIMRTEKTKIYVASWTLQELQLERDINMIQKAILDDEHFPLTKLMTEHRTIAEESWFSEIFHIVSFMAISNAVFADAVSFVRKAIQADILVLENALFTCFQERTSMLFFNEILRFHMVSVVVL